MNHVYVKFQLYERRLFSGEMKNILELEKLRKCFAITYFILVKYLRTLNNACSVKYIHEFNKFIFKENISKEYLLL